MTPTGESPSVVEHVTRARLTVSAGMLDLQVHPSIAAGRRRARRRRRHEQRPRRRRSAPVGGGADDAVLASIIPSRLLLDTGQTRTTAADARPGTILDQIPGAGERASRGERVSLLVALGAARTVTPQLDGQTPARAATLLRAAGLTLGPILPARMPTAAVVAASFRPRARAWPRARP